MRFWAGVTDNRWYQFVSSRKFDEVNFWQPSTRPPFTGLPEGTPFFFKLKRPNHHIAGGGYFVRYTKLPLITAWDIFGQQNGADSLEEFIRLIGSNRATPVTAGTEIGCTVLTDVFFLPNSEWLDASGLFAPNIMVGRTYDTATEHEANVVLDHVNRVATAQRIAEYLPAQERRYGREFLTRARLGQGSFRTLVIDAYQRRCAVTGETTLPALEAAHIRDYASEGTHHVSNGLLLRSDFHRLFDAGLISVDPELRIHVSPRIRDQYFNGKAYYRLDKQRLANLPSDSRDHPNPSFLEWHFQNRFAA